MDWKVSYNAWSVRNHTWVAFFESRVLFGDSVLGMVQGNGVWGALCLVSGPDNSSKDKGCSASSEEKWRIKSSSHFRDYNL